METKTYQPVFFFADIGVPSRSACDNLISVIVIFVVEVIEVLVQDVNMWDVLQLLFKVEGQNLTNQRTEPHKSLISKNVRL